MSNYIKLLFDNTKINKNKIKKEWIEKNIPEYYKLLSNFNEKNNIKIDKYSQLVYHYENNMLDYPKCDNCGYENKRFVGFESGYKFGCSRHCAILLTRPMSNETRKINTIKKFGVEHTTQLKSVQEKMKNTNFERYGVDHASQNEEIKIKIKKTNNIKYGCDLPLQNKEIKEKMINNFIEKWGCENPIQSDIVKDKIKENNLKKYGVEWHISSDDVRNKIKKSQRNFNFKNITDNYGNIKGLKIISYENNTIEIHCDGCGNKFHISSSLLYQRFFKHNIEICLNCNPLNNNITSGHNEIIDFLKELKIENITINDRSIITPYEIDIYLPDYNIGIEFNGLYWHSELQKPDKKYHYNKLEMCSKIGIDLIQIWEDDWNYKKDIIKSIIKNKLKSNNISIGARKCKIKIVSDKDSKLFLNENHIQGWCISKLRYGLYYSEELVSLITISEGRKNLNTQNEIFEIVRFCNKIDLNVVGSLSRLWQFFLKEKSPNKVISYCDNDFFNGESYLKIGMTYDGTSLNYWWSDGDKKYNRWNFRKDKLIREGFDKNKTEAQIMLERGWFRCYGSGNKKFTITFNLNDI